MSIVDARALRYSRSRVGMLPVESGVLEQIDAQVKEHVARILPSYFPPELVEEVEGYKQQLDEVQRALHNSCVYSEYRHESLRADRNTSGRVVERTRNYGLTN